MIRVEVEPFEVALPDWDFTLSWEKNYQRIREEMRKTLRAGVQVTLSEILP